jgi:Glucuronate isomerase
MKAYMDEFFLLNNGTAVKLYNEYAKDMPIFDYHCHLNPKEIAENKKFRNMTEIWLGGDHYKWRALRSNGVDERYINGDADDREKFEKWAETMPYCIGNPLYHWTSLELKRYFGMDLQLSPKTSEEIWAKCNAMLQKDEFSARSLMKRSNVRAVCTTDDPIDSLEYHKEIAKDTSFDIKVTPTFRPDKGIKIENDGFKDWIDKLEKVSGMKIDSYKHLKNALAQRIGYFHDAGCRLSDHDINTISFQAGSDADASAVFEKSLNGGNLSDYEINIYKTQTLLFLGREYARRNWVMQLHIGATRNNNTRMMNQLGPDRGFDAMGDSTFIQALSKMLDALDETNELPGTILYGLNPRDNEPIIAMMGCFQGGGIPGKLQYGPGWWYNDQKDGMVRQMTALANLGLLGRFVGMLTDSRSFLSYTRHEYFRRILCNLLGEWVENGEAPYDMELLGKMVQDISFYNARDYFDIKI